MRAVDVVRQLSLVEFWTCQGSERALKRHETLRKLGRYNHFSTALCSNGSTSKSM